MKKIIEELGSTIDELRLAADFAQSQAARFEELHFAENDPGIKPLTRQDQNRAQMVAKITHRIFEIAVSEIGANRTTGG